MDDVEVRIKVDGVEKLKRAADDASRVADKLNASLGGGGGGRRGGGGRGPFGGPGGPRMGGGGGFGGTPPPFSPSGFGGFGGAGRRVYGGTPPPLYPSGLKTSGPIRSPGFWAEAVKFGRGLFFLSRAARLAVGSVSQLADVLVTGASAARNWNVASHIGGDPTSARSAGGAFPAGAAVGMNYGQTAQMANSFRDRLGTDPMAVMGFGRTMIPAAYGGRQDNLAVLSQAINKLADIGNENTRIMRARQMGLESMLPYTWISAGWRSSMEQEGNIAGGRMRGGRGYQGLSAALGAEADTGRAAANSDYNNLLSGNAWLIRWQMTRKLFWDQVNYSGLRSQGKKIEAQRLWQQSQEDWARYKGGAGAGSASVREKALSANTQALELLAGLLMGGGGMGGGGARARGAIPAGLSGLRLQQAIEGDQLRLGGVVR